ncbi:hypothetical protein EXU48_13815 [Occultella glacieicola]|uniref:Uncharacterized protein n=2 Tax=Occultella glacieicola TaxID=2518684 RepID=A0ABY2E316_9MICO|nr:hypothetical protein EXU48_13815 [Occultella glacieicola]
MTAFRRIPISLIVFLGVLGAGGLALFLARIGAQVLPTCEGQVMGQGDTCIVSSRRNRGGTTWSYEERLDFVQAQSQGVAVGGLLVAVFAVVLIVAVVIRWRRDLAVADQLAGEQAPLTAYVTTTGTTTGLFAVLAFLAGGFGAFLAVGATGSKGTPWIGIVFGALLLALGLLFLWVARPNGCTLVWAYPAVVRIVTQSRIHDVPWQDMQYLSGLGKDAAVWLSWVGRKGTLDIDDKDFFATMRRHINGAVAGVAAQRFEASQPTDFGEITLTGSMLVLKRKSVAAADLSGITLMRDKNGTYYEFRDQRAKVVGLIGVQTVANADVLFDLLAKRLNVGFLQR